MNEVEMTKFKTEVLVGHLLRVATTGRTGPFPRDAFPFLCAELREKGILPDWLHWMLTTRPALFNKLFHKFFQQVIF